MFSEEVVSGIRRFLDHVGFQFPCVKFEGPSPNIRRGRICEFPTMCVRFSWNGKETYADLDYYLECVSMSPAAQTNTMKKRIREALRELKLPEEYYRGARTLYPPYWRPSFNVFPEYAKHTLLPSGA